MTDAEIIERAKATFVLDTPTERLARELIAVAERYADTEAIRKAGDELREEMGPRTIHQTTSKNQQALRRPRTRFDGTLSRGSSGCASKQITDLAAWHVGCPVSDLDGQQTGKVGLAAPPVTVWRKRDE